MQGRSLPYYCDLLATVEGLGQELGFPTVPELLAIHGS